MRFSCSIFPHLSPYKDFLVFSLTVCHPEIHMTHNLIFLTYKIRNICNSICERLKVITGFGVIVDIIAILLPATPGKIYRTIKRNDFPIFRHIRQIHPLMQIYGEILRMVFRIRRTHAQLICYASIKFDMSYGVYFR